MDGIREKSKRLHFRYNDLGTTLRNTIDTLRPCSEVRVVRNAANKYKEKRRGELSQSNRSIETKRTITSTTLSP